MTASGVSGSTFLHHEQLIFEHLHLHDIKFNSFPHLLYVQHHWHAPLLSLNFHKLVFHLENQIVPQIYLVTFWRGLTLRLGRNRQTC